MRIMGTTLPLFLAYILPQGGKCWMSTSISSHPPWVKSFSGCQLRIQKQIQGTGQTHGRFYSYCLSSTTTTTTTTTTTISKQQQKRSFVRRSFLQMMPEGPEIRTVVDQLQTGVGRRLVDIQFLSGRYVRHGRPNGFAQFAKTMTPIIKTPVPNKNHNQKQQQQQQEKLETDIIQEWGAKGKFIYIVLDQGSQYKKDSNIQTTSNTGLEDAKSNTNYNSNDDDDDDDDQHKHKQDDFYRSIWITFGMTGQFVSEAIHERDPKYARWYLELLDVETSITHKIYYHDQRNFGTLKFCLSRLELQQKLQSLGQDILDPSTTVDDFLTIVSAQRPTLNICIFLMDQSKLSGIGNYILSECLYRAKIDPFASLGELNESMSRTLFKEIQAVARESYASQGLTRRDGGTFRNVEGNKGSFEFQLQCYGRETCVKGNIVIKDTNGPHKRTIWYTTEQLFMPLSKRYTLDNSDGIISNIVPSGNAQHYEKKLDITLEKTGTLKSSMENNLIAGLEDNSWKTVLSDAIQSETFARLEEFIEKERDSGATIFPPQGEIFSAFNLCPFDQVKVVIVGQDPYHGPGQGHGLAFSVRHGVTPPPSLRNIFREVVEDVGIDFPSHGNLENWARQGVLLLNTVLTVRRGEANSHSKRGWEEFTDAVIREIDERRKDGVVFLLWGNPAAQKAKNIDESKHIVIRTSHPSPLGATKTKFPFLGSRCFSRVNQALQDIGKKPIDWSVDVL